MRNELEKLIYHADKYYQNPVVWNRDDLNTSIMNAKRALQQFDVSWRSELLLDFLKWFEHEYGIGEVTVIGAATLIEEWQKSKQ